MHFWELGLTSNLGPPVETSITPISFKALHKLIMGYDQDNVVRDTNFFRVVTLSRAFSARWPRADSVFY